MLGQLHQDSPGGRGMEKGDAPLAAGLHDVELRFYENSGGFALKLEWESPGAGLKRQEVRPLTQ